MLNVQFVVFPCLKWLVEASITFYCVIHKNRAPSEYKKNKRITKKHTVICSLIYFLTFYLSPLSKIITYQYRQIYTAAPVGDFESSRWCESIAGGGFGCDPHATELFIVLLIPHSSPPVSGPAAVPGAQGPVALLKIYSIQVSTQLKRYSAGPALPRDSFTGFHLWIRRDRGTWIRWKQRDEFGMGWVKTSTWQKNKQTLMQLVSYSINNLSFSRSYDWRLTCLL